MPSVKVSTKYQISLPNEARCRLGIAAGDRVTVEVRDDELVLKRQPEPQSQRRCGRYWNILESQQVHRQTPWRAHRHWR